MIHERLVQLGNTDIKVSPVGLGTMQWGTIKAQPSHEPIDKLIGNIFSTSLEAGINFYDTAEIYGFGRSEIFLGNCDREISRDIIIATKFMPFPWRINKGELRKSLLSSLHRLGVPRVDLYQVHWPFPPVPIKTWLDGMADLVADGLVRAVGVSNYSVSQTAKAYETLNKRGIPLASNQIKFNLLDRHADRSGLFDLCKELNITIIAYSPLEIGVLTAKYDHNNPPSDIRCWRYNRGYLKKLEPLFRTLKDIGKEHGGKTSGQVALNWLVSRGVVPIPGAKNAAQATENAGAMGWFLTEEEIIQLNRFSEEVH